VSVRKEILQPGYRLLLGFGRRSYVDDRWRAMLGVQRDWRVHRLVNRLRAHKSLARTVLAFHQNRWVWTDGVGSLTLKE
jgi:hypothetical protein